MSDRARSAADDAERRSRLSAVRLRALVAEHLGRDVDATPGTFPGGAALLDSGAAWVSIESHAGRRLGPALAWALRNGAATVNVVAGDDTGLLARRAARFALPVEVWFAEGRTLLPAPPEPLLPPPAPLPEHLALADLVASAGATPIVEHGVVVGEVRGLEVCRVVDRPTVGHVTDAAVIGPPPESTGVLLEVGVGANDREAFQILHGELPTVDALRSVVARVARHRQRGAPQHPLNRLMAERFLRWEAEQQPASIGMRSISPAEPPLPRPNLKDPTPCVATGIDELGGEVSVVFTSGVDLDLAPFLADVHEMAGRPLAVVAPARDLVPITRELVELLDVPVRLVAHG